MLAIRRGLAPLAAVAVAVLLAFTASPAAAVIGGTDDTANRYANVGALQLRLDDDEWAIFCSATLVAPDIVLTAAHCTDFFTAAVGAEGLGPDDLRVSFDVAPDENSTYYYVDE